MAMKVALFVTCLTDTFFPRVGEAVVRVLRHFGCEVDFPDAQTCCGQPAFNSGFRPEATALARRMIGVFEPYGHVVTPSASCAAMVKHHFPELFTSEPEMQRAAERLAERTDEFSVFMRDRLKIDIAPHLRFDEPYTYHYACHARDIQPLPSFHDTLQRAGHPNTLIAPQRPEICCGFGGMFAVDFPEVSAAMMTDKLDALAATGAETVVCNEGGCTLNLCGGAHRRGMPLRFVHVAEVLAESLGLMPRQAAEFTGKVMRADGV